MKKLFLSLFMLAGAMHSAYAINIGQYFTLINKTDIPLRLNLAVPNQTKGISVVIAPNSESKRIYVESDAWGFGYTTAPFYVGPDTESGAGKGDQKNTVLVKGLVIFHAPKLGWRYSYLSHISAGQGLKVDESYSCAYEGNIQRGAQSFDNKITIEQTGPLGSISGDEPGSDDLSCKFLNDSSLTENDSLYKVSCSDGSSAEFEAVGNNRANPPSFDWRNKDGGELIASLPQKQHDEWARDKKEGEKDSFLKKYLDHEIGTEFCTNKEHAKVK